MAGNPMIYALYRGDEYVADGTVDELANKLNVKTKTIYTLASRFHHQSVKQDGNAIIAVKLGRKKEIDRE